MQETGGFRKLAFPHFQILVYFYLCICIYVFVSVYYICVGAHRSQRKVSAGVIGSYYLSEVGAGN